MSGVVPSSLQIVWNIEFLLMGKIRNGISFLSVGRAYRIISKYHAISKFSRQQMMILIFSLFFFLENRIWHFMQIVS